MKKLFKVEAVRNSIILYRAFQEAASEAQAIESAKKYAGVIKNAQWRAREAW